MRRYSVLCTLFLLVGCTRDLVIGAEGDGAPPDGPLADGGGDGTPDGPLADGGLGRCGAEAPGAAVPVVVKEEPYVGLGGAGAAAVPSGIYDLVGYTVYWGGALGTGRVREALVLDGSPSLGAFTRAEEITGATGAVVAHPLEEASGTYRVAGASPFVTFATDCPAASSALLEIARDGEDVLLGQGSASVVRRYRRRP